VSIDDRLKSLKGDPEAWKSRGDGFRGEVAAPVHYGKDGKLEGRSSKPEIIPEEPAKQPEPVKVRVSRLWFALRALFSMCEGGERPMRISPRFRPPCAGGTQGA
jgi:hypothetical protein